MNIIKLHNSIIMKPNPNTYNSLLIKYVLDRPSSHVGHVRELRISAEVSNRRNFTTLAGFAIQCHVTSP